jgi:hypothetical protein
VYELSSNWDKKKRFVAKGFKGLYDYIVYTWIKVTVCTKHALILTKYVCNYGQK